MSGSRCGGGAPSKMQANDSAQELIAAPLYYTEHKRRRLYNSNLDPMGRKIKQAQPSHLPLSPPKCVYFEVVVCLCMVRLGVCMFCNTCVGVWLHACVCVLVCVWGFCKCAHGCIRVCVGPCVGTLVSMSRCVRGCLSVCGCACMLACVYRSTFHGWYVCTCVYTLRACVCVCVTVCG